MSAAPEVPTRRQAIRLLERGRAETLALVDRLPPRLRTRGLMGPDRWSAKDAIGHVASWEEHALDALAAWNLGERAPIDAMLAELGTAAINRQDVERARGRSLSRVRADAERIRGELLDAIRAVPEGRWRAPAGGRGSRLLAVRLGRILGGPAGLFRHEETHHQDLQRLVDASSG